MFYGDSLNNQQPYEKILNKNNADKFLKSNYQTKKQPQQKAELIRFAPSRGKQHNSKGLRGQLMVFCFITGCITMILDSRYFLKNKQVPKTVKKYTDKIYKEAKTVIDLLPEITDEGMIQVDDMASEFIMKHFKKASLSNAIAFSTAIADDMYQKRTPDNKRFVLTGEKRKHTESLIKTLYAFNKYIDRNLEYNESYEKASKHAQSFNRFVFNE